MARVQQHHTWRSTRAQRASKYCVFKKRPLQNKQFKIQRSSSYCRDFQTRSVNYNG
ncbi:hypothetical protein AMTR_s00023p00144850 [Amborella trichopoda]|uniref:Uncharacterized protein n=1 Tax=Amborella trichopoda TaxID=13333 RepID=W1NJB5_AMBTC|nr:hypothetical protein AMTR_s00023p00144850 [Amborella trichopoda]